MFKRILTVCTGNICRSPLAEAMLAHRLQLRCSDAVVRSAGIGALELHPADEITQKVAAELGLSLDAHRARQISLESIRWADLILVMEKHHLERVLELAPTARGKTFLIGHWSGSEIPDPYRKGEPAHRQACDMISSAVDAWLGKI